MDRHGSPWTPPEDWRLMSMLPSCTTATIARSLGRSTWAVLHRAQDLRTSPSREGGLTSGQASQVSGYTPQYLTQLARRGKVKARRMPGGRWWMFDALELPIRTR